MTCAKCGRERPIRAKGLCSGCYQVAWRRQRHPGRYQRAVELNAGYERELHEVEQVLGKAIGYPWYKDDQQNFPGATEKDGVCTGEATAVDLAVQAAKRIEDGRIAVIGLMRMLDEARKQDASGVSLPG